MCGVSGFFVGCDLAMHCGKGRGACELVTGKRALKTWHEKASVRHSPRHILNEQDVAGHLYPLALAPTLRHPLTRRLDGERVTAILTNHLFRYLDFTIKLEIVVVNDVAADLAFGQTPVLVDRDTRVDALKIYTDEAYHALFSADLLNQARTLLNSTPIVPERPAFLQSLWRMLGQCESEHERRMTKLFFVATSETLITSSLTDIRKAGEVPEPVRRTITDHAMDEARHHAFFSDLIRVTWPRLEPRDRARVVRQFPEFILAFVQPDVDAIQAELASNGLSPSEAETVVAETYTTDAVSLYAKSCGATLLSMIRELPEFDEEEVRELYSGKGLL